MKLNKVESTFQAALLDWGERNYRSFPWREMDEAYLVLLAEILLQRTLASKVESVYEEIVSEYPNWKALAGAEQSQLASMLEPLGLQNRKSKALIQIAKSLENRGVPKVHSELVKLPFVGRYAANATLCYAFGNPRPIVDVNVVRIYNRVFSKEFDSDQDDAAWEYANRLVPVDAPARYNSALLDFGAKVCTASSPDCHTCPQRTRCQYYENLT